MIILGIETSCDETGIALVCDGKKILAEGLKSSVDLQREYGGVVPELASRVHVEYINLLIKKVLSDSGLKMKDIDAIAVANGPGLAGALLVGTMVAKTIGMVAKKKIVSVNHLEGHIYSSFIPIGKNDEKKKVNHKSQIQNLKSQTNKVIINNKNIKKIENIFPLMVLIVSGGHTELVLMENFGEYRNIGTTIDDAAGEAFDKAARILGLPYPGGPSIAHCAIQEVRNKKQETSIKLPRPMMNSGNYNFSFSGLKTALLYEVKKFQTQTERKIAKLDNKIVSMLAYEFQEAVADVLVYKTKKAMQEYGVGRLAVVGGVAANNRLREKLYEEIEGEIYIPEIRYCTDNGVKIAVAGYYKYMRREFVRWQDLEVKSNWELG